MFAGVGKKTKYTHIIVIFRVFCQFKLYIHSLDMLTGQHKKIDRELSYCIYCFFFLFFFNVRLLSVLRGHSFFFIPVTTANDLRLRRIFYPRCYQLHLFSYLNSWKRASIFPFECSVLNKGTTGTICITSLVWRGPWLGIEPGTSRTRSEHYTTRLSGRQIVQCQQQFYVDPLPTN